MKDYLQDIVQHTYSLGIIDAVKIAGTEDETAITTIAEDRSVIVEAKFKNPVPELLGTFGMPNLGKLNTILNIPEYREDAKLKINYQDKDGQSTPVGIHFENATSDFKNDYRFMTAEVANEKLKTVKFRGVKWNVELSPTVQSIQRLKFQSQANSEETTFIVKTENGDLKFYFGDAASHAGNFVFQTGVTGNLHKAWSWPVNVVMGILNLSGDKEMKFSDEGAAMITVDSGIAVYNYIIPAQTK